MNPTWYQHPDFMQVLIVMLAGVVAWFAIRALQKIDRNQTKLFEAWEDLSRQVNQLQGEHNALKSFHLKNHGGE